MTNSADPDLDLHCLQRQGISGFSRTRVKLTGKSHSISRGPLGTVLLTWVHAVFMSCDLKSSNKFWSFWPTEAPNKNWMESVQWLWNRSCFRFYKSGWPWTNIIKEQRNTFWEIKYLNIFSHNSITNQSSSWYKYRPRVKLPSPIEQMWKFLSTMPDAGYKVARTMAILF